MLVAVIVTFFPDLTKLHRLILAIKEDVDHVVIVDNGSSVDLVGWVNSDVLVDNVFVIVNGGNYGIAKAQNTGVDAAIELGAEFVILFDQDSFPRRGMIACLKDAAYNLISSGAKVAAIGPRYVDQRQNNPEPFVRIEGLSLIRLRCASGDSVIRVDYLIASGSLIPVSTLKRVGGMDESLFIDYVDIEWGLRAKKSGYLSYGVCSAIMQHDLGDDPVKFLGRLIPMHSPLRHYYHFRNAVYIYIYKDVPFNWKLVDAWKLFLKYVFYSIFTNNKFDHFRMMTLGIFHGAIKHLGALK